jgi:outer membrane receptor protein involved in Fe transport/Flp pilus assembly protein TadD
MMQRLSAAGGFLLRLAIFLLLLFLLPGSSAAPAPGTAEPVCVLLTREGKVEVAARGTVDWRVAESNQVLHAGDRLRTGLRSRATLQWSGLSVLRVNELTSLELQPPAKPGAPAQLDLRSGASYFFSRERPEDIQFRTPVASGAIRGTEFHLAVAENGRTELSLLDGQVDLTAVNRTETLQRGEQGVVNPGQPPTKTALLNARAVMQWVLYYPAVAEPGDVGLSSEEAAVYADSLQVYRAGDLLGALARWPEGRQPATDAERVWQAALLLGAGQAEAARTNLAQVHSSAPAARALREVIAAVSGTALDGPAPEPSVMPDTASEAMARSYWWQSRSRLPEALEAARRARERAPDFGAAWVRVAELEFSFGQTALAGASLGRGLELSPRNAQGLALRGFLLAAAQRPSQALEAFNQAITVDGALANAWLGRGLLHIRQGRGELGRQDLQVAATLEPQRGVLRSYLGKAFSHAGDQTRATKELALARELDPADPTAWLYQALLFGQENRINEAVKDLERSKELNDSRSLFRSRLLLDQDRAVRSANLASIYRDAGLKDFGAQEAARAVNDDYANSSAHLFLAESYDALRDPKLINLRYETPAFSELLLADLLSPAAVGTFSPTVSQQEYSRFFEDNHLGLFSSTEYFSSGDWVQRASQYGVVDTTSYSVDAFYRTENGQRPNNDLEQLQLSGRFKQQLTPQDTVLLEASYFDTETGDVAQYYKQSSASTGLRVKETQEPNLILGYHHEWGPGSHTLFLGGRFDDTLQLHDDTPKLLFLQTAVSPFSGLTNTSLRNPALFDLGYRSELEAYSAELQHIWQTPRQTLVIGGRYQVGWTDTSTELAQFGTSVTNQHVDADLNRLSFYGYEQWTIADPLRLTAGVSYDRLHYPRNIDTAPIVSGETSRDQVSPKVGLVWTPLQDTRVRAAYTRSLGGVFFDNSVRLEPTQVGGFNQAFRSLIPESVVGLVPGTSFETWGVGLDQEFKPTHSYLVVEGQMLRSDGTRTVGLLTNSDINAPVPDSASSTRQALDFRERSLLVSFGQLIGPGLSLGARYKLTHADLNERLTDIPANLGQAAGVNQNVAAILHQVWLSAVFQHQIGAFAEFSAVWSQQSNQDYTPDIPGDDFWQLHIQAGWRFYQRRVEARVGVLNLTDQNYRLNPLTLYNELPRERTFVAALKWHF